MTNETEKELIQKYDEVYEKGEQKFWTFLPIEERLAILRLINFTGKTVLEIGCGTGDFAAWMATAGAEFVRAIDVSGEAIRAAVEKFKIPNLSFGCDDVSGAVENCPSRPFDIVVMVGVLEHMIDPANILKLISENLMHSKSQLVITCPMHLNPRGYIWAALKYLFDAPMSLTDRHEITPAWIKYQAEQLDLDLVACESVDMSWGTGSRMIEDYLQRLPKVFPDMPKSNIHRLIEFLDMNRDFHLGHGANGVYVLRPKTVKEISK